VRSSTFYRAIGKRGFDLLVVIPGLLLCVPLLLLLAIAVRLRLGSPVLFRQSRPGRHGRPFEILKFRTMRDLADENGQPLEDALRLTPFGRFLRAASLDELPELINVFKGEMSLVGPRPLLMQYLGRYSAEQARRHQLRPGITGHAQVNGRNLVSWDERFRLDVWYVDHCSLLLDLKILLQTIMTVVKREGITSEGHASMPEFMGSEGAADERESS
jgi:lipopolysaccharide/colanic/teichoic acid biosynthesis glycosyltransferase